MNEITDFKVLKKGDRVRKYISIDKNKIFYKDGTVVKGLYGDGFVYVQWDGESHLDMSEELYDLVKLRQ